MASPELRLLGGFALRDGRGEPVPLQARKAQALLALLARRPGEALSRARLAALLWPDRPEEQGRASLRQALAALRRALAACGAEGPGGPADALALPREALRVDVAELEAALAAGDLEEALARFGGPLLDGFPSVEEPFDDWLQAERAGLASRAADLARRRLPGAAGDPSARLALAERALALDPALEVAYRARMRVLLDSGDRAGALREYERCKAALARHVGAPPSAETEALRAAAEAEAPRAEAAPAPRRAPTLAVLPFEVDSEDPAAAPFARGLEEDVAVELGRFRALAVIARDAARRAAGEGHAAAALGRVLGAEYLLGASVRGGGGRLRVAARLVEAASGRQVWAERFDADQADVFAMQERIAREVASALTLGIDASERERARGRPPERLDAYACWVQGMTSLRRGTPDADRDARALFLRALALDPSFARAHAGLSLSHFNDWSCAAWERWDENERAAFAHAQEALALDDRDGAVHAIVGRILLYRREFDGAAVHLERALALSPGDADVLANLAIAFAYLGAPERGLGLGRQAMRLHPYHPAGYVAAVAANHFVAREATEAAALLARVPDAYVDTRAFLAAARAHTGERAAAADDLRRFLDRFSRSIAPGAGPAEATAWVLRVNPFRRSEDRRYLVDGLAAAGLPIGDPEALAAPA